MKKTIVFTFCLLLLLTVFAGCGKDAAQPSAQNDPVDSSAPTDAAEAGAPDVNAPETEAPVTNEPATEAPTEPPVPATVAEDTCILTMRFAPPEGYETVERGINKSADGILNEKDIFYYFEDGSEIGYTYVRGYGTSQVMDTATAEAVEQDGKTFYLMAWGDTLYAFADAEDGVYGVTAFPVTEDDRSLFDLAMQTVSFGEEVPLADSEDLPAGIRWEIPDDWTLAYTFSTREETPDGSLVSDRISFSFGEDPTSLDWRFTICAHRGTTLEEQLGSYKEYGTQEVGGVVYTVDHDDYNANGPTDCWTQQGDDVWVISNSGVTGLFSNLCSEESIPAFETFLGSIRFE